jgi:ABC-type sugar transport system ATPase subunit
VSFHLYPGEVLGLAGLVGAGRTETARLIVGADRARGGTIHLDGRPVRFRTPAAAQRAGIGLVPEERRSQGLVMSESITFNMTLGWRTPVVRMGGTPLLSTRRLRRAARDTGQSVALTVADVDRPVSTLSGGNQQKVVLGRWLGQRKKILVFDEPTRGVDVGARAQIHALIRESASRGIAVLVISSDVEELVGCDRVLVMFQGRVHTELVGDEITEKRLLTDSYGPTGVPAEDKELQP